MKIQRCKGSRDLPPAAMEKFRLIEGAFRDCCLKWGYQEVRTPTLEYLHLFTTTGTLTPSRLNRVYSFLDWDGWSGERVVLRPDGTIPVARLYIDSPGKKKLAKLFYVANIFAFEATGEQARERWQCGAELIGVSSPAADAELITLAVAVLQRLGLEGIELRLSHAGVIRALLQRLGLDGEQQIKVFDQILDGDSKALAAIRPVDPELEKALSFLLDRKGKSSGFLRNLRAMFNQSLPELKAQIDNLISIVDLLEARRCGYRIDIASGRGFEYYTGVICQFFWKGEKIGGGGRYDDLIPLMGGGSIPASGFALYLDPIMNLIRPPSPADRGRVLVRVGADAGVLARGAGITCSLREVGYVAELDLGGQELADFRWLLDIGSEGPPVLTDQARRKKFELKTADEALQVLGEESADKDSPT